MRNLFAIAALILARRHRFRRLFAADQSQRRSSRRHPADKAENRLDKLFAELKRERNEKAAERIAGQIWEEWFKSGSASIDLMMMWSQNAMERAEIRRRARFPRRGGHAVAHLCRRLEPSRDAAFHDVATTASRCPTSTTRCSLEPRHFGALSGMAQIMKNTGKKELALKAYQRVLEIYPMMRSAQNEVATLSEELAGEGI